MIPEIMKTIWGHFKNSNDTRDYDKSAKFFKITKAIISSHIYSSITLSYLKKVTRKWFQMVAFSIFQCQVDYCSVYQIFSIASFLSRWRRCGAVGGVGGVGWVRRRWIRTCYLLVQRRRRWWCDNYLVQRFCFLACGRNFYTSGSVCSAVLILDVDTEGSDFFQKEICFSDVSVYLHVYFLPN